MIQNHFDLTKMVRITDNEIHISIPVAPVTKKNHNRIVTYGQTCPYCKKKPFSKVLPSDAYKEYSETLMSFLPFVAKKLGQPIDYKVNIKCVFYRGSRRKSDLVGYLQSIQDILVEAKILLDDNSDIVVSTDGSRVEYDKYEPRTEIVITKIIERS